MNYKRRMRGDGDTHHMLSGWVEHETQKAVLFHSDFMEAGNPIWLPLSQVSEIVPLEGDINRYEITVKYWLIQRNAYQ